MKYLYLLLAIVCFGGCSSPAPDYHPESGFSDHSSSPISETQARNIAKAEVEKREGWPENKLRPDGIIDCVLYSTDRINNGGWRVIARRAIAENRVETVCGYVEAPAAVILINKKGAVKKYTLDVIPNDI